MEVLKYIGFGLFTLVLIAGVFLLYRFYIMGVESQNMAPNIGVENGRLADCPDTPNCVSSYAENTKQRVDPIHGSHGTMALIASYVQGWEEARLVTEGENYLHIEVKSALFGFIDDLEFYFDGALIQVRSASRVGHSDLNANRKRVESIRKMIAGRY